MFFCSATLDILKCEPVGVDCLLLKALSIVLRNCSFCHFCADIIFHTQRLPPWFDNIIVTILIFWRQNKNHTWERVTKLTLIMLIIIMMMLVLRCKLIINNNDRIAGSRCIKSKLTGKGKLTWGSLETRVTLKLFQEKNYFGKKWSAMYIMLKV